MHDILDLDRYPLDKVGSPQWWTLVERCKADLAAEGMYNLDGLVKPEALARCIAEIMPAMNTLSFTHTRDHNIYFMKSVPGLPEGHPALAKTRTINHTVCADQISQSLVMHIYEWAPMVMFLQETMEVTALYPMLDPLARVNVMAYRAGEALNWHFDRSTFTTTLLLQSPEKGGEFVYRKDLRSETDPNYEGVARLMRGEDPEVKSLTLAAGTLNVFRGRNTAHKVATVEGARERLIAVFSYYPMPGVMFTPEEQRGFYGRTA
jgi:hypothetical protein